MKIWYQSSTALWSDHMANYREHLMAHVNRIKRPDVEVVFGGVETGSTALDYNFVEYLNSSARNGGVMSKLIAAERAGFDGLAIGCFLEPAYYETREIVSVPLLSLGQVSMHVACWLGDMFGGVAFCDKQAQRYNRLARGYGLADRLVPFTTMHIDLDALVHGFEEPEPVLAAFRDAAREAVERGAEVVIPASGTIQALIAKHQIYEIDGARVLDPVAVLVKMTEALVDLSRVAGMNISRKLLFSDPDKARRDEILELYGMLAPVAR